MYDIDNILQESEYYCEAGIQGLIKLASIKKMPDGKYRVVSQKGKNLGTYPSREKAMERLKQVEFFKHRDKSNIQDMYGEKDIDLTDADDFSFSAIMRKMREKATKNQVKEFLKIHKDCFDKAVKRKLQKPEKVALQNALIKFNKRYKIKVNKKLVKNAAISELGDPVLVGKYLADIVRFTLNRISSEKRPQSIQNLRNKLYYLNENEISSKKMPASSALGQSITFVKHVLFNQDASYIREVLNNLVKNL